MKIYYTNKETTANTQYVNISSKDFTFLRDNAELLVSYVHACQDQGITEISPLLGKNPLLPRRTKPTVQMNSPYTLCNGVLANLREGQYNLTDKQLQGLQVAFKVMSNIVDDFEPIELELVDELPKLKVSDFVTLSKVDAITTFEDLFEISIIIKGRK